jgi:SAM-dependent methyltransferase
MFNFVDLGCGKGRTLAVASEFPFIDIVGVELSSALVSVARANAKIIARNFPSRTGIRVVEGDAATYDLPAGDLVLYLYNPFAEPVVARVVQALEAAMASQRLGRVYVVYYNPVAGHCFDASAAFCRHSAFQAPYSQEEMGFGPDESDAVVIWQDLRQPMPQVPANLRIVLHPSGRRVSLVDD